MHINNILNLLFMLPLIGAFNVGRRFSVKTGASWMCVTSTQEENVAYDTVDATLLNRYTNSNEIVIEKRYADTGAMTWLRYEKNTSTELKTFDGYWPSSILNCTFKDYYHEDFRHTKSSNVDNLTIVDYSFVSQPYTSTGLLKKSGSNHGTCFLLSNGYALTAAHCVYFNGEYTPSLTATFSFNAGTKYTKTVKVVETYIPEMWKTLNPLNSGSNVPTEAQKNVDWAILKFDDLTLPKTFGATTIASNATMDDNTYYMALGYPQVKNCKLSYSLGKDFISKTEYRYDLYTSVREGMSGGPLIGFYDEYDDHIQDYLYYNYIIGIVSTGEPDTAEKYYYNWGGFTRITNTMIDIIGGLSK